MERHPLTGEAIQRSVDRLAATWPQLRYHRERRAEFAGAFARHASRLADRDLLSGVDAIIERRASDWPPSPAEVLASAHQARTRRLQAMRERDEVERTHDGERLLVEPRLVANRVCSRSSCRGPLTLLREEGVLWCGVCSSVQRADPTPSTTSHRTHLTADEIGTLEFFDEPAVVDYVSAEMARALLARIRRPGGMERVADAARRPPDPDAEPELAAREAEDRLAEDF